ncbi:MAG: hypothetical protein LBK01_00895 [Burkholderiaceae bacterium]|nr:hypothetical protein [Burkholderiaceae bacterium]
MDELDYWRLADTVSLVNAAALIIEAKPSDIRTNDEYVCVRQKEKVPFYSDDELGTHLTAALNALSGAVKSGQLPASKAYSRGTACYRHEIFEEASLYAVKESDLDYAHTMLMVDDLKKWLASCNVPIGCSPLESSLSWSLQTQAFNEEEG